MGASVMPNIWQALHRGEMVATGYQVRQITTCLCRTCIYVGIHVLPLGINWTEPTETGAQRDSAWNSRTILTLAM